MQNGMLLWLSHVQQKHYKYMAYALATTHVLMKTMHFILSYAMHQRGSLHEHVEHRK